MLQAIIDLLYAIYQYTRTVAPASRRATVEDQASNDTLDLDNLLPVYDPANGQVIGFVSASRVSSSQRPPASRPLSQSAAPPPRPSHPPLNLGPNPSQNSAQAVSAGTVKWDYWPDGTFEQDFDWEAVNATSRLMSHWAVLVGGGDRKGNEHATSWERGKKSTRSCLGIIACDNPDCSVAVRPHTKSQALANQLATSCECGARRFHHKCSVRSTLWTWSGGIHFRNEGFHSHDRPARLLHLSNDEKEEFTNLVKQYPNTGPLGLIVGVPGIDGPGQSAADISDTLLNADRVSKERLKIKNNLAGSGGTADFFISAFSQFDEDHPNFVRLSVLGKVSVIAMQSPFMASQLIHNNIEDSPINGLVNDAAHGWWQSKNCLLMVTSSYCSILRCWVPVLFSYTNGASAEHFKHHFLTLFQSIALQAASQTLLVTDHLFTGVMDFSEAERNGFIEAFVTFWSNRGDDRRSEIDLREDAGHILRGCQEHFRAGVTRLSRISGVIPLEKRDAFLQRAVGLLSVPTEEEFALRAKLILRDFPKTASWLNWWIRPAHASMLFEAHRTMDISIWESILATTNAEEAMHWKLYAAAGRNHSFMEGLRSLYAVAAYYERSYKESQRGVPTRYGQPERWKIVADQIGRTKPTRAPDAADRRRKKNDGRPPDTVKELLNPKRTKKQEQEELRVAKRLDEMANRTTTGSRRRNKRATEEVIDADIPSYVWKKNSCWLDTSLELLHVVVQRDFEDFMRACERLSLDSPFQSMYATLLARQPSANAKEGADLSKQLSKQRDKLRTIIVQAKEAQDMSSYEPLFSWFHGLLARERADETYQFAGYFEALITEIQACTGSTKTQGRHLVVRSIPRRVSSIEIGEYASTYRSDVSVWFTGLMSIKGAKVSNLPCWRKVEGETVCSGRRTDTRGLVVSIPIMLMLRVPEDASKNAGEFPQTLTPLTKALATKSGLIYDLVGFGLYSKDACHFTAQYTLRNNSEVCIYDGMKNNGYVTRTGRLNLHEVPKGYSVNTAVYHLRGGSKAQIAFFEARRKECSKRLNINVTGDFSVLPNCSYTGGLVEMSPAARIWMKASPNPNTREYVPAAALVSNDALTKNAPRKLTIKISKAGLKNPETVEASPESEDRTTSRLPSPSLSLANSEFTLNCRCGVVGDGNILYRQMEGAAIKCDECESWSHIACQRDGRASLLQEIDAFTCDLCNALELLHPQYPQKERESRRKLLESRLQSKKPLTERLIVGRGALARNGDFWYPARLIDHKEAEGEWLVRWWREAKFESQSTIVPGSITAVSASDIVDSLWGERVERRKIRLGQWTHAHEIPTIEDILADPSSTAYTPEMHEALMPSIETVQALLISPEKVDALVPARTWLEKQKKPIGTTIVPFTGNLSVIECAQLGNWFEKHIALGDQSLRRHWLSLLPFAHTCTLWLAALIRLNKGTLLKININDDKEVLEAAWQLQMKPSTEMIGMSRVDVDKECLEHLEEEMFERSALAGKAGRFQWGLDAGDHQGGWNPYSGTEHWSYGNESSDDEELHKHGPNYAVINRPPSASNNSQPRPRPRPRAPRRVTKK